MPQKKSLSGNNSTRQKSIEKELLEQKKLIAQMARFPEMNPGPVLRMNTDGKILLSNTSVKNVFKSDLLNKNWKRFRKEITDELWKQIISSDKIVPIEISVGKKCFVFHHRRDKLSDLIFAYGSDISLNKQNEIKLEEQKAAMAAMARFPDMNPGPVIRMDITGKILLSNTAAQQLFGENITGCSWLRLLPELGATKWKTIIRSDKIFPFEARIQEKDFVFNHRFDSEFNLVFVYGTDVTLQKLTENQLRHSEKMASLGELTAGIAHEIQNPLNFVNNFSEVSNELIDELHEELAKGNLEEAKSISEDIKSNLGKINYHGKRADAIVKGMLQHSRKSEGEKQPTHINALCEEYLRLAYHGFRAKDKLFEVAIETNFDKRIGKINIIPQDIGHVMLNLINNACYAVREKSKENIAGYQPSVFVTTRKHGDKIEIEIRDNGKGISHGNKGKIFQPFFTTKPTGSGTGLGLSLSYDIVKAHGGDLNVSTKEGDGSEFIISLPV